MDLGISVADKKSGGAEAGLDLFAGAKFQADVKLALKMRLVNEKEINTEPKSKDDKTWDDITEVSYGFWAAGGLGVEAGFQLGYFDGRWRFHAKGLMINVMVIFLAIAVINNIMCHSLY